MFCYAGKKASSFYFQLLSFFLSQVPQHSLSWSWGLGGVLLRSPALEEERTAGSKTITIGGKQKNTNKENEVKTHLVAM